MEKKVRALMSYVSNIKYKTAAVNLRHDKDARNR